MLFFREWELTHRNRSGLKAPTRRKKAGCSTKFWEWGQIMRKV